MRALSPPDAAMYWRSLNSPTDQFLLYAFALSADGADGNHRDGNHRDGNHREGAILGELRERADRIADLHLRIDPVPGNLDFPRWTRTPIRDDQFRLHPGDTWEDCLLTIADMMDRGPAAGGRTPDELWRVHVFGDLTQLPTAAGGHGRVVVLQMSHALGDGRTASAIARCLLSAEGPPAGSASSGQRSGEEWSRRVPIWGFASDACAAGVGLMTTLPKLAAAMALGIDAWRRAGPTEAAGEHGLPSTTPAAIVPTRLNVSAPAAAAPKITRLRTVTVPRKRVRLCGPSVTTGVLAVLGTVLPEIGGSSDGRVVAEVTIAREPVAGQRNNFFTTGIDLRSDLPLADRAMVIDQQLRDARVRDDVPVRRAERRAAAQAPAVLESLAVVMNAASATPARVAGTTIVSSVNRGPDDLALGGGRVLFTAGFPALSAVHGLSHGVHGIGDVVTISIASHSMVEAQLDRYVAALEAVFNA
ncbi:MAG: hypothetical protein WBG47_04820 [Gordonia sp. (in: high G+C Gram-positive bacteria)]|uniref:hypothetical protein n=1 Tax=Gordonia sp. (in: high G+C Gram-positive bacteria) TaxID=84139 RepID=UPI003C75F9A2